MSNRVTLAQLTGLPKDEALALPAEQVAMLLEDVAELKENARKAEANVFALLELRYSNTAAKLRSEAHKDTGTVRFSDGDYTVIADLPKRVSWSESGLADVEQALMSMGEPPGDYIKVKRDVSERAYGAWPASLRKMFDPHRTVGVGKASYKLEKKDAD